MATHSSALAWGIPRTEEVGGLKSMGLKKSWTRLSTEHRQTQTHRPEKRQQNARFLFLSVSLSSPYCVRAQ